MTETSQHEIVESPNCSEAVSLIDGSGEVAEMSSDRHKIIIDEEFKNLIPEQSSLERKALEQSLLTKGCLDPLKIWPQPDGETAILLDGHHRYDICCRHNIRFRSELVECADREEAANWIYSWQLSQRNLTPDQLRLLRGRRYNRVKNPHGGDRRASDQNDNLNQTTSEQLAQKYGVSSATIVRDGMLASAVERIQDLDPEIPERIARGASVNKKRIIEAARVVDENPEQAEAILTGEITLKDLLREEGSPEVQENLEVVDTPKATRIEAVYDVIVIDPPWPLEEGEQEKSSFPPELNYPMMTIDEIREINPPVADDCHLWLWAPQKHFPSAIRVIEEWGLSYVCVFVWRKPGTAQFPGLQGNNCEFAIYAHNGSPEFLKPIQLPTCFDAPHGLHGEKPKSFHDAVLKATPGGRRLDMFGRRKIEGFERWGNESPAGDSGEET
jgi:N6-adenosine-specific RNA methylase IME4